MIMIFVTNFCVCVCMCACLSADSDPPTDLVLRQIRSDTIEISWTPPPIPPSRGYQISITGDFDLDIISRGSPYNLQPVYAYDSITVHLVARTIHFHSGILGPKPITVFGEEIIILSHSEFDFLCFFTYQIYSIQVLENQ